ncbi:acyl-CoA N-acyltransferase [Penicillium verhagenii]|nr:acyl-CoA N-acyltransferase [Penicillium verhagenii]
MATLSKGFVSERLLYRAVEDSDEDKEFIWKELENDPNTQSLTSVALHRPLSKKGAESHLKMLQETLLAVIVCIRPDTSEADPLDATEAQPDQVSKDVKDTKPIPIGQLIIAHTRGPTHAHHRCAKLGISLIDGHRGKGYGPEAINWALDWAFQSAGMHRVSLGTFSFNQHGIHLYRKLGFVEEGRERETILYNRAWYDIILFSMLESEWEKLRGISQPLKKHQE